MAECEVPSSPMTAERFNNSTPARKTVCLATPVRSSNLQSAERQLTPLSHIQKLVHSGMHQLTNGSANSCTPELSGVGGSSQSHFRTPLSVNNSGLRSQPRTCNPFETRLLNTLHQSVFSPNVFKTSTPGSKTGTPKFKWTIDELALLKPADIELPVHQDTWFSSTNSELEEQAQQAIDKFFSSSAIMPSPWTDSSKKKPFQLPLTPGHGTPADSPMIFCNRLSKAPCIISHSPAVKPTGFHPVVKTVKDAAVQTVVTIPTDFDLESVLGAKCHYEEKEVRMSTERQQTSIRSTLGADDDVVSADVLSNSSLRRKLFFHGDEGTPLSPVRSGECNVNSTTTDAEVPPLSPSIVLTSPKRSSHLSQRAAATAVATATVANDSVLSDLFSSSPIKPCNVSPTSSFRRCSTAPQLLDSPPISPISSCYYSSYDVGGCGETRTCDNESPRSVHPSGRPSINISCRSVLSSCRQKIRPLLQFDDDDSVEIIADEGCQRMSVMDISQSASLPPAGDCVQNVEQADTGYQSNIMQTTSIQDGPLSVCDTVMCVSTSQC